MRKYSYIYSKLVSSEDDFVGLIAYAIYKKHKSNHLENFSITNGRSPTHDELDAYHTFTASDDQTRQYRIEAEKRLGEFTTILLKKERTELENFYRDAFDTIAREKGQGYWYGIGQNIVASFLYTLLLGVLVIILWAVQVSPTTIIEKIFKVQIIDEAPPKEENDKPKEPTAPSK